MGQKKRKNTMVHTYKKATMKQTIVSCVNFKINLKLSFQEFHTFEEYSADRFHDDT